MAQSVELPRQSDGDGLFIHFTGGFRAARVAEGEWQIEPVLVSGRPCAKGPLTMEKLQSIATQNNFRAIAFQSFGWSDGEYHSSWLPIVPGRPNHSEGPAGLWSNVAGNISRSRTKKFFQKASGRSEAEIANAHDDRFPEEAFARYISLSLRSMDISVEQIAVHYYEQLVNHLSAGLVKGERRSNTSSQVLYAHVHSFFLHLGAARDYLGALISHRIGLDPKIDSMALLVGALQKANRPSDTLLDLLFSYGNIDAAPQNPEKFAVAGWLKEANAIRRQLVHKRPYGSRFSERAGWALPSQEEAGLFRYFRPFETRGTTGQDVLDVIHQHYNQCAELFRKAAKASGNDTAMLHIADEDLVSHVAQKQTRHDN